MNKDKSIKFAMGERYQETAKQCPNCRKCNLFVDNMSDNIYVCLNCKYVERRES